jgi:adenine-specific DNA-methyltransferase
MNNQPIIDTTSKQDEYIEILKKHFPSVINQLDDGSYTIDKEQLQLMVEPKNCKIIEDGYGLKWVGKKEAYHNAYIHNNKILKPLVDDSKHFDTTSNILIKGDNLDALKLLKKNYFEKIKMIYIDPPYNTQSDGFIYNDNFTKSQEDVLEELGYSEDQKEYIKNIAGAKTHSGWLSFMYPRLLLARDLLKDDGVIFISIDENEHANLKLLCDEIFGDENFAGDIVWKNSSKNDEAYISMQHEYVLVYVKSKVHNLGKWEELKEGLPQIYKAFEVFRKKHSNNWEEIHKEALAWFKQFPDSNPITNSKHYTWMDEKGVYFPDNISGPNYGQYVYDVIHPITGEICKPPASGWRFPEDTLKQRIKDKLVHFGKDHTVVPNNKTYLKNTEYQSLTSLKFKDGRVASNWLKNLFGIKDVFTNPKDSGILMSLMKAISVSNEDIVLDFFAGSGTTGDAVMQLNAEDGGNRKFILVQLPEKIDPKKSSEAYKFVSEELKKEPTIFEITAERLRRAGQKILKDNKESKEPKDLSSLDIGFKIYEVADDQYNSIYDKKFNDVSQAELALIKSDDIVKADSLTILTNLLLGSGIALDTKIDVLLADSLYRVDDKLFILKEFDLQPELFNGVEYATIYARYFTNDSFIANLTSFIDKDKIIVKG